MKIAPGIHRIGDKSIVNSYLVEDSGDVTIIDAGVPGFYRDIPRELAAMGRTVADVRALVLTHGHTDHIGFAERLRREQGIPVSVHEMDVDLARGDVPNPSKGWVRPSSDLSWGSCGSPSSAVGSAPRSSQRSPPSGTVRPWMCRGAHVSS